MGENLVFYCLKPETIFLCANPSEISLALPRPRLPRPLRGTKGLGASLQTDGWWLQKEKRWKLKSVLSSADEFTPHRKKLSPHTVQHVSCIPLLEPCLVLAGQHQPYLNQVNWQISLETFFLHVSTCFSCSSPCGKPQNSRTRDNFNQTGLRWETCAMIGMGSDRTRTPATAQREPTSWKLVLKLSFHRLTTLPRGEVGKMSPYPTVVIVITTQYRAAGIDVKPESCHLLQI